MTLPSSEHVINATQEWLDKAVIGLNLCPFAKAVQVKRQIRYVVSQATSEEALLADLLHELQFLHQADPSEVETTLLIHPGVLTDFLDYNDFLEIADAAVGELDLEGELQVASFHPDYQFADSGPDDIENYSNRARHLRAQYGNAAQAGHRGLEKTLDVSFCSVSQSVTRPRDDLICERWLLPSRRRCLDP
jgi:hypothetical protein